MTYEELEDHVMDYFGDTSRSAQQTKEDLSGLVDHIEMLIESLPDEE